MIRAILANNFSYTFEILLYQIHVILMSSKVELVLKSGGNIMLSNDDFAAFNNLPIRWRFNVGFDIESFLFDTHFQVEFSEDEEFVTYKVAILVNSSN